MKRLLQILAGLILLYGSTIATTYYVDNDRPNDNGDGTSWGTAEKTIAAAITDANAEGDVILVKYNSGGTTTYSITSTLTISGKNIKLTSDDGNGTGWDDAEPDSSKCIIDGTDQYLIMQISGSSVNNNTHIRGFRFYRGRGQIEYSSAFMGGGMYILSGASPIIENCWFLNNYAAQSNSRDGMGGGVCSKDSNPIIQYNFFDGNYANTARGGYGGGLYISGNTTSMATIRYNTFSNNLGCGARGEGGAIYCSNAYVHIHNNDINNNTACGGWWSDHLGKAGGIYCSSGSHVPISTIEYNIIRSNKAHGSTTNKPDYGIGGGLLGNRIIIRNNTFYANADIVYGSSYSSSYASGVFSRDNCTISNNIFINHNVSGSDGKAIQAESTGQAVSYCCFYNNSSSNTNTSESNCLSSDPLFTNASGGDFSLQSASPCIDSGDPNSTVPEGGEPCIDFGANEYILTTAQSLTGIDNTWEDNIAKGNAIAIVSETGTVNATVTQSLNDPSNLPDGARHIGKYWNISSLSGNAKIRLYYNASAVSSFDGTPTIYHYTGSAWEALPTEAQGESGTCRYVETTNYYSSFSDVTVGDGAAPLPVELTSFTAQYKDGSIELSWTTATEVNNYGFEVERQETEDRSLKSEEGWETLGFVEGHGNSNSPKEYSFVDDLSDLAENPPAGILEYRLKQIDSDGSFKYYNTIAEMDVSVITTAKEETLPTEFSLAQNYPNPFNPVTTIKYELPYESKVKLEIFNLLGQKIETLVDGVETAGMKIVEWNADKYSTGVYIIRITAKSTQSLYDFISIKKMAMMK